MLNVNYVIIYDIIRLYMIFRSTYVRYAIKEPGGIILTLRDVWVRNGV